jgi:hypothetical protein
MNSYNNDVMSRKTIKQIWENKQLYNCLSETLKSQVRLYKHYNLTFQQLNFIQGYNSGVVSKDFQTAGYYARLYNKM